MTKYKSSQTGKEYEYAEMQTMNEMNYKKVSHKKCWTGTNKCQEPASQIHPKSRVTELQFSNQSVINMIT